MGGPAFATEVAAVAQALDPGGARVRVFRYGDLQLTACDWHPSAADHQRLADGLFATIQLMGVGSAPERSAR
jgi:hypothetical protein